MFSIDRNHAPNSAPEASAPSAAAQMNSVAVVSKSRVENELIAKTESVIFNLGYGLRDLEVLGGSVIRVTLETLDASTAIGIEDCSKVHDALSPMFDVWDPLPSAYTLEISSPGEKPTMRLMRHFEEAVGQKIKAETTEAVPMPPPAKPRKRWEGTLKSVDAGKGEFVLEDQLGEYALSFAQVKSAVWLRDWTTGSSEKPGKKKMEK